MPDWTTLALFVLALLGPVTALVQWLTKLLWSSEYRALNDARIASKEEVVRTKEAQIAVLDQMVKAKDINIEMYKSMSFVDVQKQFTAQTEIFQSQRAEYERQLSELATQLEAKAAALDQAKSDTASLRLAIEQSAALTRQAVGTLSQVDRVYIDYNERVDALMHRDDDLAVVLRGNLQAMEEANRIALRGRSGEDQRLLGPLRVNKTIPPDTTGGANMG